MTKSEGVNDESMTKFTRQWRVRMTNGGCKHFRVIDTRPALGGRIVCRRKCRHCGKQITTWEKAGR